MKEPDLANALMAEITARLEDLAAASIEGHRGRGDPTRLRAGVSAVLDLIDAHIALKPVKTPRQK